jgi:hypothetical protein
VIDEFCGQVRDHVGPSIDLFLPAFSTTGPAERVAAGIVLLDAMQSYFSYNLDTLCGIPSITLEGTPEDWQAVADRAEEFGSLELEWWLEPLREILKQFVAASRGVVDGPFWRSFYKYLDESGGPQISGWVSAFFPYLKDRDTGEVTSRNPWLTLASQRSLNYIDELDEDFDDIIIDGEDDDPERETDGGEAPAKGDASDQEDEIDEDLEDEIDEDLEDDLHAEREWEYVNMMWTWLNPIRTRPDWGENLDRYRDGNALVLECGPSLADLPSGLSKAPFRWQYIDRSLDMEFLGGFVGVAQDSETLTLRPEIGWAVREAPAAE